MPDNTAMQAHGASRRSLLAKPLAAYLCKDEG